MSLSPQLKQPSWWERLFRANFFEPRHVLAGVLAISVLLRLSQYGDRRSLWLDEASLALNFFDGDLGKLLHPLENRQAAPVGFNLLSGLIVRIAGISGWSLRLLPLLAGLTAIFVFWRLSQRWLRDGALLFANYTFAISSTLVYYSNEFKPYILDVLLGMLLFSGVIAWWEEGRPRSRLPWLAVMGCLAVWFSFPVVFVMAGAGGVVLAACWRERKFSELRDFSLVVSAWLISFGCQYLLFSRQVSQISGMVDYWRKTGAFMPLPWKHGGLTWFTTNFFGYFQDVAGLHNSRNILQFIFICGIIELTRRRAAVLLSALLAPFALVLLASALELYPFQTRLALFTVPFALLLCGEGIDALLKCIPQPAFRWALLGIALFSPSAYTLPQLWQPVKVEEVRPLAEFLQREAGAQDVIFVFKDNSSFAYYARQFELKETTVSFTEQDYATTLPQITEDLQQGHRCWLVISHVTDAEQADVLSHLQSAGSLRSADQEVGAQLFEIKRLKQPPWSKP